MMKKTMRPIKFRAKVLGTDRWAYGYLEKFNNCMSPETAVIHRFSDWSLNVSEYVDPETVGQWTGYVDQHGAEIYEGDIINAKRRNYGSGQAVVLWHDKAAAFGFVTRDAYEEGRTYWWTNARSGFKSFSGLVLSSLEVVGNIYEAD